MMQPTRTLRRLAIAVILAASFMLQGTWALAATTGGIGGVVQDDRGTPVADATVTATSPSETATATTDAHGHFVFLVLQPDTYTLTVQKEGYQTVSIAGNTVFADQTQQVSLTIPRQLVVIAHARAVASNLVKPGIAGDIYNVTPAQQTASQALGGGGNLNTAYSAIASVPGVFLGTGSMGWDQAVVIHGQNPFFTSFEVEGIPVNRAFDNYPSSTESNLGLQELQIYTGGGPSDITSNGVSGFINNVIKTGTYPGYASLQFGVASEAFYHQMQFEAGGSTPDRNFTYYVGISGYNSQTRFIDNNDGPQYLTPGAQYQATDPYFTTVSSTSRGVFNDCSYGTVTTTDPNGCWVYGWGGFGEPNLADRENVVNLHFGIPRKDGQRDDIQALWWDSNELTFVDSQLQAIGPGVLEGEDYLGYGNNNGYFGGLFCNCTTPPYLASYTYNLPFGSVVNNAAGTAPVTPTFYAFPNTVGSDYTGGCAGYVYYLGGTGDQCSLPTNDATLDNIWNDLGAVKLQWTHPFSGNSYMRVYAYSLFSDWDEDSPTAGSTFQYFDPFGISPNYMLNTHTTGGSITYANQLTDANLFSFEGNYEQANSTRFNNLGLIDSYADGGSEIGLIAEKNGKYTCYDQSGYYGPAGGQIPCYEVGYGYGAGTDTSEANALGYEPAITGAALAAGAQYETLWNANTTGDYNAVSPHFWNFSFQDQWRPNDKWLFDVALRYDDFTEELANEVNPANNFQTQIIDDDVCWNPTLGTLTSPLAPGEPPPEPINYETTCPTVTIGSKTYTYVHPPFTDVNATGSQYTTYDWEPRFALTYTSDPDTVWRLSAGRYAQPALSAAVQYGFLAGGSFASSTWANFLDQGFMSPEHEIPNMTAAQYSGSYEHHFRGTELSVKISPFYTQTSNWLEDNFIGENYVTQFPTGDAKNYGVELAISDGDFAANGFAGMISFTYTDSLIQYQPLLGLNQISQMNTAIEGYNALTKAGGGSPCYIGTVGQTTCGAANPTAINNPYYSMGEQPLLDPNGWYPQEQVAMSAPADYSSSSSYNSPYVAAVVLNWRHDRFAITPSLQYEAGQYYGSPLSINGVDPRDCSFNQNATGIDPGNYNCDYTTAGLGAGVYGYLFVPNPQTGKFDSPGEYEDPSIVLGNLQLSYDFPKVKVTLTAADLWHTCFGGSSEPWTTAYPPNAYTCGYGVNGLYNGAGWYNGTSPYDKAANYVTPYAWEEESYAPSSGGIFQGFIPFNLYIQAQIHL